MADHSKCKKAPRWYSTCADVWVKAQILALQEKAKRGVNEYSVSELIDSMILEKSKD